MKSPTILRTGRVALGIGLLMGMSSCGEAPKPPPLSQRLVDAFEPEMVTGASRYGDVPQPTEWRFEDAASPTETLGWEVLEGVERLQVRDGRLVGRTSSKMPILNITRDPGESDLDPLHEIQLRMRVSAGTDVGVSFHERMPPPQVLRLFWSASGAIIADGEMRTYTLKTSSAVMSSSAREIFLRPTNAAGAEFEIESVRLVFRREHLAEQPSGVGWYGLAGDFRETVVARAPETIRWSLTLPDQPRLELGLGTLDQSPMTFRVSLDGQGDGEPLLSRTLASPGGWEETAVDLAAHAGREVTLLLTLDGEPGTPGLWGAPAVRGVAAGPEEAQGVILILADTLRPDRLSFYGHERATAPQLGRLVEEGTLFRDAHAHAPWTRVSVPSIVTSLYPLSHGLQGFFDRLPNSAFTLAEAYRTAGWATVGFSSIPHTGRSSNMHQGYESLHELPWMGHSKTAREFVDRLLPWLDRHQQERFFVFLHVFDPHFPYPPISADDALWSDSSRDEEVQRQAQEIAKHAADPLKGGMGQGRREELESAGIDAESYIEHQLGWYDGSIRGMDRQLGRVLDHLKKLHLNDRTLVVFTSDHGEEFLEHDWMGHGHSLYDEVIHVPLFFWKPGLIPEGKVIEQPVQHVDLMPTLLELSGLATPETAQGQSLVPLLAATGTAWRERPTVIERPASEHPASPAPRGFSSIAVIFDGWKLIHHGEGRGDKPEYELYDHRTDPGDLHDLAPERPEMVARLSELLDSWRAQAESQKLQGDTEPGADLSQEELERLRSLGYIQ